MLCASFSTASEFEAAGNHLPTIGFPHFEVFGFGFQHRMTSDASGQDQMNSEILILQLIGDLSVPKP